VCRTATQSLYYLLKDFKGLNVEKLEKYFLLLAALDENLSEYKDIKKDLQQVKHASSID